MGAVSQRGTNTEGMLTPLVVFSTYDLEVENADTTRSTERSEEIHP